MTVWGVLIIFGYVAPPAGVVTMLVVATVLWVQDKSGGEPDAEDEVR